MRVAMLLVVLGAFGPMGCSFQSAFEDYCADTGKCTCADGACCVVTEGRCGGGIDCCPGSLCLGETCVARTRFDVSKPSLAFGPVPVGTTAQDTIVLRNIMAVPAFLRLSVEGEFEVGTTDCPSRVPAGKSCTVTVIARPVSISDDITGRLFVSDGDALATIPLTTRSAARLTLLASDATSLVSDPAGISCPEGCTSVFPLGATVTLTHSGVPYGHYLRHQSSCPWREDRTCTFVAGESFVLDARPTPNLELYVVGSGQVRVNDLEPCAGVPVVRTHCLYALEGTVTLEALPPVTKPPMFWMEACWGTASTVCTIEVAGKTPVGAHLD